MTLDFSNKLDLVIEQIKELSGVELVTLNNIYCDEVGDSDNCIHSNDQYFFEDYFSHDVIAAVRAVAFGDYNYSDNYVKFNGYGNLETFHYLSVEDLPHSVSEIADYAIERDNNFEGLLDLDFEEQL
jgi:hypothetical protein